MKHGWRIFSILCTCTLLSWAWASAPVALTRGPYLQNATISGITLVCKTSVASVLTLRYGERADPPWTGESSSPSGTTHVFTLEGLRPETRYFYELADGASRLAGGAECSFRTSPPARSRAPFRFLAWGDSGTGSTLQGDVAARMEQVLPAPTFALGLGDLVYDSGAWADYDPKLFQPYAQLFRSTTFWATLGNHDVQTENGAPYFDAFHLPTQSGAPGQPSGTEHYYSFEHGMAHFTCLDSESSSPAPGGAMYAWAQADLEQARAAGKRWLFVYMHHPPYTRGTHDSTSESDLIRLHDDLVPLFEAQGVDLVLSGHSHVYERSYLARNDSVLQNDVSEYTKIGSPDGTVYLVTGCGGKTGNGPLDHPLMARSYGDVAGFNVIDVSWSEVRGRFIEGDGNTTDLFTLRKAADTAPPHVAAIEPRGTNELALVFDEPVRTGAGPTGAENPANYALGAQATVLGATLDSDRSTVLLDTTPLAENQAYTLDVSGVADPAGHAAGERVRFVRGVDTGRTDETVVPRGATWRYFPGWSAPGTDWVARAFDDSSWSQGPAGFGFGDGDDATQLPDMRNGYACVYTRHSFDLADPSRVSAMRLRISFDDGFVAYLNGSEVARERVPIGQDYTTVASGSHEAGTFETFDLGAALPLLLAGENVLALEGHNASLGSDDFSLHPELVLTVDGLGGPPRAAITAEVRTANAPARLAFSGARSSDADGPIAAFSWDFGDGTGASGVAVEHVYATAGAFDVTLVVRDAAGLEDLERVPIRVHTQGSAPRSQLAASTTQASPGASVDFDSAGSLDPDGGTLSFTWDFGDPASGLDNVSNAAEPSHTYATEGTYTATLVVTDDEGSSATDSVDLTVGGGGGGSGVGEGGSSGGGSCSVAYGHETRGDPLLAAILALALLGLSRRRGARWPAPRALDLQEVAVSNFSSARARPPSERR